MERGVVKSRGRQILTQTTCLGVILEETICYVSHVYANISNYSLEIIFNTLKLKVREDVVYLSEMGAGQMGPVHILFKPN